MSNYQEPKFEGWLAKAPDSVKGNFEWGSYKPKAWEETDAEMEILYCGICGSDLHTASSGWGPANYPQVVGHEIVGRAIRVGSKVSHIKVGDIVGVGAQSGSCLDCHYCTQAKTEQYCENGQVGTYGGSYYNEGPAKGDKSYGGYANFHRAPAHFYFKIPDAIDPAEAAPMLCGGVTVYSPLKQYGCGTTAKEVGVIGIGGLGHFAVLFAKALGANVTAISHSENKKELAHKLGATGFIATHSGKDDDFKPHKRSLDLIICTTNDKDMPLSGYLSLLKPSGTLVFVGLPEEPLKLQLFPLVLGNVQIAGSAIGSTETIREMLQLAADQQIHPMIEKRPMSDVNKAVPDMKAGKARFRYVLCNTHQGAKL